MSSLNDAKNTLFASMNAPANSINEKEKWFYENFKPMPEGEPYEVNVTTEQRTFDEETYSESDIVNVLGTLIKDLKTKGVLD